MGVRQALTQTTLSYTAFSTPTPDSELALLRHIPPPDAPSPSLRPLAKT